VPRSCSVCRTESRSAVERSLLRQEPLRDIARRTGLSKDALARHRKNCLNPLRRTRTPTEGRSTLLTPDRQSTIVETIRKGSFDWVAARTAGITPQTFQGWLRKGEGEVYNPIYTPFAIEVRRAQEKIEGQA
jgi:transposase-like protein